MKNIRRQLKYAWHYTMIYNCAIKCYEHTNPCTSRYHMMLELVMGTSICIETSGVHSHTCSGHLGEGRQTLSLRVIGFLPEIEAMQLNHFYTFREL